MPKNPYNRYRPTDTDDSRGGSSTALGTAETIWGEIIIQKEETIMLVDIREDVVPGDIIETEEPE